MTVVDWVKTIQDVGFPILIVIYILFRLNKNFHRLEQTVRTLVKEIHNKG